MKHGGLFGDLVYVDLTYEAASIDGLPVTMLAKFAPSDLKTRITTDLFELNKGEVIGLGFMAKRTQLECLERQGAHSGHIPNFVYLCRL